MIERSQRRQIKMSLVTLLCGSVLAILPSCGFNVHIDRSARGNGTKAPHDKALQEYVGTLPLCADLVEKPVIDRVDAELKGLGYPGVFYGPEVTCAQTVEDSQVTSTSTAFANPLLMRRIDVSSEPFTVDRERGVVWLNLVLQDPPEDVTQRLYKLLRRTVSANVRPTFEGHSVQLFSLPGAPLLKPSQTYLRGPNRMILEFNLSGASGRQLLERLASKEAAPSGAQLLSFGPGMNFDSKNLYSGAVQAGQPIAFTEMNDTAILNLLARTWDAMSLSAPTSASNPFTDSQDAIGLTIQWFATANRYGSRFDTGSLKAKLLPALEYSIRYWEKTPALSSHEEIDLARGTLAFLALIEPSHPFSIKYGSYVRDVLSLDTESSVDERELFTAVLECLTHSNSSPANEKANEKANGILELAKKLKEAGSRNGTWLRARDLFSRFGGDESKIALALDIRKWLKQSDREFEMNDLDYWINKLKMDRERFALLKSTQSWLENYSKNSAFDYAVKIVVGEASSVEKIELFKQTVSRLSKWSATMDVLDYGMSLVIEKSLGEVELGLWLEAVDFYPYKQPGFTKVIEAWVSEGGLTLEKLTLLREAFEKNRGGAGKAPRTRDPLADAEVEVFGKAFSAGTLNRRSGGIELPPMPMPMPLPVPM